MKFFNAFADVSPQYRYLGSGFIIWSLCFFTFKTHEYLAVLIDGQQRELKTLQQNRIRQRQLVAENKKYEEDCAALQDTIHTHVAQAEAIDSPLAYVAQQAHECKITINGCFAESERVKTWYTQQQIQVQALGSYQELTRFLAKLRTSGKMIECKNIQLSATSNNKFNAACTFKVTTLLPIAAELT